jgi:hypothetical protein
MKRLLLTAGAIAAMFGLTACNPVYIGDSILWQVAGALGAEHDDELIDATIGRGPDDDGLGDTTLRKAIVDRIGMVEPGEDLIIEEAGDHPITPEFVRWVVATVPDDLCLVWVTPHDNPNRTVEADVAAIKDNIGGQPCHRVIDWHLVDTTGLTYDGLHLNDAGIAAFVDLVTS